jgi:hypothetical protein
VNERLPSPQVVKGTQRQQASGVANRGQSPASTAASKTRSLSRFDRAVLKGGDLLVYHRIWDALDAMSNPHGVVCAHIQTVVFAVRDRFPEYPRPTVAEVEAAIVYGRHVGRLERLPRHVTDPEGIIAIRFLKGSKNDR